MTKEVLDDTSKMIDFLIWHVALYAHPIKI